MNEKIPEIFAILFFIIMTSRVILTDCNVTNKQSKIGISDNFDYFFFLVKIFDF
jgi:hypothetical protein